MKPLRLSVIFLMVLLAGCAEKVTPPEDVRPLRVVRIQPAGVNAGAARTYSGEVRARVEATLAFRVGGKVLTRQANVGDHVKAGQVLATLDPQDSDLAVAEAEARRTQAQQELARVRDLFSRKYVSQAALDAREADYKAAEARWVLAKNQTAYTVLRADKSGVIGQVMIEPGQVVSSSQGFGTGQAAFRIAYDGEREVAIAVPERDIALFTPGRDVVAGIYATPGVAYKGRVREVSSLADPATRTFAVRVTLQDATPFALGLSAGVQLVEAAVSGMALPPSALFQKDNRPAVWVVGDDDKVRLRPVGISRMDDDRVIVADGLKVGERVAAAGVHRLQEGQAVRPVEDGASAPPASTPATTTQGGKP